MFDTGAPVEAALKRSVWVSMYAIWYPPALCGFLFTVLSSVFWVQVQRRYAQTEARKLDAAGFRHS